MNTCYEVELRGCAPEPLMAYLKALGIFRLVSEQKDSSARAWWQNDSFYLSSDLDRDALVEYFLHEYRPTPIVSPWNGGSGFYPRDNQDAINAIQSLTSNRLKHYRDVILAAKSNKAMARLISQFENAEAVKDAEARKRARKEANKARSEAKDTILAYCRAEFPDNSLDWIDAAYVLTTDGPKYPPLLGTGGNDGRLEFSNNFMQNVVSALKLEKPNGEDTMRSQLGAALFSEGSPQLTRKPVGFYNPGAAGGANASVGFNDESLTNPWDYVLMFEGTLLFAGTAARRLSAQTSSKAVYPFTVDNSAAGYGTSVDSEYGGSSRSEFWAPLWDQPVNLQELKHLVSEGRAQLGRRQVSSGADFARAISGLGTERGVSQFQRYGFLVRNGLAYLATPLGRFNVRPDEDTVQRADVLFDLDIWMDRLRRIAAGNSAPAGLGSVLRQIEQAIFEFCRRGWSSDLQTILIAVGHAEQWLSKSSLSNDKGKGVRPLNSLSHGWLRHANDSSPEFRLARAIASILPEPAQGERKVGPIRENMDPVDTSRGTIWKEDSVSFVWTAADPLANMLGVLERRCLEGRMQSLENARPPLNSAYPAGLDDLAAFLEGNVDFERIAALALPLSFVRYWHRNDRNGVQQRRAPFDLPMAYAVMKLTLLTEKFVCPEYDADTDIWIEPQMLSMLRAGRVGDAYQVACRRLRASGLQPLSDQPGIRNDSVHGRRLAAALLFPIDGSAHLALAERALLKPRQTEAPNS